MWWWYILQELQFVGIVPLRRTGSTNFVLSPSSCFWRVRRVSYSLILKISWSFHLFFGRPMFFRPFGLYHNACFGILFVSILCTWCSHFFWYCFIFFTMLHQKAYFFFILSYFILPSAPRFSQWSTAFGFTYQNHECISPLHSYVPHAQPIAVRFIDKKGRPWSSSSGLLLPPPS